MKRVRSDSAGVAVMSKIAKIKNTLLSAFGRTQGEVESDRPFENKAMAENKNRETFPFSRSRNSSFENGSQSPITARQLEDYYNSLRRENEALSGFLNQEAGDKSDKKQPVPEGVAGTKEAWNNAESTNIETSDLGGDIKPGDGKAAQNEVILFDENNTDSNLEEENDTDAIGNSDIESLGLMPIFSQPDPLERANLVQLKKMMELEKYRRYRLSYLRQHTRNLKSSNLDKVSKSIAAKKYPKFSTKLKLDDIPAGRRNKTGTFGLSLLDTMEDKAVEDRQPLIQPIGDNVVNKLRFPTSAGSVDNFVLPSKPRSFKADDSKPTDVFTSDKKSNDTLKPAETIVRPIIKPSQTTIKEDVSIDDKPSIGFTFQAETKPTSEPAPSTAASKFSFGKPAETSAKVATSSTFKFGAPTDDTAKHVTLESLPDKDGLNDASMEFKPKLDSAAESKSIQNEAKTKVSFLSKTPSTLATGGLEKSEDLKSNKPPSLFNSKPAESKPFSLEKPLSSVPQTLPKINFGSAKTEEKLAFSFTKAADSAVSNTNEEKPKFTFGAPSTNGVANAKFSFGTSSKDSATTPALKFGANDESGSKETKKIPEENDTTKKSVFSFGSSSAPSAEAKPALSFGLGSAPSAPAVASTASTNAEADKPKFSFGGFGSASTTDNKGTGVLLSKPVVKENESVKAESTKVPAFSFGAKKTDAPAATVPLFGANSDVPKSTLTLGTKEGGSQSAATSGLETAQTSTAVPKFNFGSNTRSDDLVVSEAKRTKPQNGTPASTAASTFSFGGNSGASNANGLFSGFGGNTPSNNVPTAASKPLAGTSDTSAGAKPAFSFGSSSAGVVAPSNVFNASANNSNSNNNNIPSNNLVKTGFGGMNTNNNTAGASGFSFGTGNPGSTFGAGNAAPAFGAGAGAGNTGSVFGQSANTNGSSSSGANAATPGKLFSFSTNKFPALDQVPKSGGFGTSATPNFNFGANAAFNGSNTGASTNNVGAFPSNGTAFGAGMNMGMGAASTFGAGMASGNSMAVNGAGSAFNFGGSLPTSGASSRATTPNINFAGPSANMDPSTIFGASQGAMQNGQAPQNRRKAYPRGMRRR